MHCRSISEHFRQIEPTCKPYVMQCSHSLEQLPHRFPLHRLYSLLLHRLEPGEGVLEGRRGLRYWGKIDIDFFAVRPWEWVLEEKKGYGIRAKPILIFWSTPLRVLEERGGVQYLQMVMKVEVTVEVESEIVEYGNRERKMLGINVLFRGKFRRIKIFEYSMTTKRGWNTIKSHGFKKKFYLDNFKFSAVSEVDSFFRLLSR